MTDIHVDLDDHDAVMRGVRGALNLLVAFGHRDTYLEQLTSAARNEDRAESVFLLHGFTLVAGSLKSLFQLDHEDLDELALMHTIEKVVEKTMLERRDESQGPG